MGKICIPKWCETFTWMLLGVSFSLEKTRTFNSGVLSVVYYFQDMQGFT